MKPSAQTTRISRVAGELKHATADGKRKFTVRAGRQAVGAAVEPVDLLGARSPRSGLARRKPPPDSPREWKPRGWPRARACRPQNGTAPRGPRRSRRGRARPGWAERIAWRSKASATSSIRGSRAASETETSALAGMHVAYNPAGAVVRENDERLFGRTVVDLPPGKQDRGRWRRPGLRRRSWRVGESAPTPRR